MDESPNPGPSVRKRVMLTLYLVLPFLILALLMWTIAYQLQKQGAELGTERTGNEDTQSNPKPIISESIVTE